MTVGLPIIPSLSAYPDSPVSFRSFYADDFQAQGLHSHGDFFPRSWVSADYNDYIAWFGPADSFAGLHQWHRASLSSAIY